MSSTRAMPVVPTWPGRMLTPSNLFLTLGTVVITAFIVLVPAGWGLDEQSHVNRAWQISEGNLHPDLRADGVTYGGSIPKVLHDFDMLGHAWSNAVDRAAPYYERHDFRDHATYNQLAGRTIASDSERVSVDFSNAGSASFLAYVPAALGFLIAKAVNAPLWLYFLMARGLTASVYVALVFAGLRVLRSNSLAWPLAVVALMPTALFQASYVNADVLTNASAFLLSCFVLTALTTEGRIAGGSQIGLAMCALLLAGAKSSYAVLVLGVLLIPAGRFWSTKRAGWAVKLSIVGATALAAGLQAWLSREVAAGMRLQRPPIADSIDTVGQMLHAIANPLEFLSALVRSAVGFSWQWGQGLVGAFGYNQVLLPLPLWTLCVLTLALSALHVQKLPWRAATALLVLGLATCVMAIALIYASFNAVGAPVIEGVQGRYFVPVLPFIVIGLASLLRMQLVASRATMFGLTAVGTAIPAIGAVGIYYATLF